ncbi:MAG: 4-alpha-glucanotransferase [Selenomonadaceae bacterium]|nr:4-alpha-glucanotransferase [Selenomonadaceae bacterium]
MIDKNNIEHNSHKIYYRSIVGAAEVGSTIKLGIKIKTYDQIKKVLLRTWQDYKEEKILNLSTSDNTLEKFYTITLNLPDEGCLFWYYFIIVTNERTYYYGNNPEQLGGLGMLYDHVPPSFQITVYEKGAKTPDWFKHSVMYQIFPDRFCREGNEIVEKPGAIYHASWNDDPRYFMDSKGEVAAYDFFGGNIKGLISKLDYLKDFGISVIYLNPVFESESNHHYDTGDYHKIDSIFGTNEEFHNLIEIAREKGIKIILDGVFSHTGADSIYFNRKGKYNSLGAYQSKKSPYYEWYIFRNYPNDYDCWWNFWNLPNIEEKTPSYRDFIIHKEDSVLKHWLNEGISGWRLDVIDELPMEFTEDFYSVLKKQNPEAVIIGEVWEDASNKIAYGFQRQYLCGREMDSAMNYPFREHLLNYLLGNIDGKECFRRLDSLKENYPKENFYAMMNLIGSHDRARAMTILGDATNFDEVPPGVDPYTFKLDERHEKIAKARLLMAALWQMTYPGVPCVYYGDEIAMQGFKDPTNRRTYKWDGGDDNIRQQYKKFIAERNNHTVLQTGELLNLYADVDVVAYARVIINNRDAFGNEAENDSYIVVFNRSIDYEHEVSFEVSDFATGAFVNAFDSEDKYPVSRGKITLTIKPLTGLLLRQIPQKQNYDRRAGILLHPTSLPSKYGVGDLGKEAFEFVDYLKSAGQSVWQILPLNPAGNGHSPYQSSSALASNPILISIDDLIERGLLDQSDVSDFKPSKNDSLVDFDHVTPFKNNCFKKAFKNFVEKDNKELKKQFDEFCKKESYWLDDYALFLSIKQDNHGKNWADWDDELKQRDENALAKVSEKLADEINYKKFLQFLFSIQWQKLHDYAKERGIDILGDMPIFVAEESSDAWANQKLFKLNEDGTPKKVAGVPPDYFSATGQLWGNPQYDWDEMELDNFAWWKLRFKRLFELVDIVRIDHFRGFEAYWEVDAKEKTAINGKWIKGPGKKFFDELEKEFGDISLRIVAEDLGVITDEVEELRNNCNFPGMKILQFELDFNEEGRMGFVSPENSIVYTGTHDNNTTVGWFMEDVDAARKVSIADILNADIRRPDDICQKLIEFAYASNSRMAVLPMQDVLKLDSVYRMNTPGTVGTNWKWRLKPDYKLNAEAEKLKALCDKYKR